MRDPAVIQGRWLPVCCCRVFRIPDAMNEKGRLDEIVLQIETNGLFYF
jgi:hypothetical protein